MAPKALPSQEVLRQLLDHDPETGALRWKERSPEWFPPDCRMGPQTTAAWWNKRFSGNPAFCRKEIHGHLVGTIFGERYKAHRIIWKIVHGVDPVGEIDHINGNPADNRLINLREATTQENCRNRKSRSGSSSGYRGVSWNKSCQRWCAAIGAPGVPGHIGLFDDEKEAAMAYDAAASRHFGDFARLNFPESHQ